MSQITQLPTELKTNILYFLDYRDICAMHGASKEWNGIINKDTFWHELFRIRFPKEDHPPSQEQAKNRFRERITIIFINDHQQLSKVITSFFCTLKVDKKRELHCSFVKDPFCSLKLTQCFGQVKPNEETNERFYYQFTGSVSSQPFLDHKIFDGEQSFPCPGSNFSRINGIGRNEIEPKALPLSLRHSLVYSVDSYGKPELEVPYDFINGKITNVDVGYGNTLGFYSQINDWKSPFSLFCIPNTHYGAIWVGLIPLYHEFKFVSIDPYGQVTWEKGNNRSLCPSQSFDSSAHAALASSLELVPIRF